MWNAIKRIFKLPTTDAEHAALRDFRQDHPGMFLFGTSAFVDTVADEPTRVVVRIRFRPPQERTFFRFYAVDRATMAVELIVDDSAYLPNNRLK
jgi:hypothetical protein